MNGVPSEVWSRLSGERAQGETLWARRAMPEVSDRLIAALDSDAERHFLISLQNNEGDLQDNQSRGLLVSTRELAVPGHEAGRYIDIACRESSGHDAFNLIGGDIAERLASGHESAPEVVARVLAKWRRFWGQSPRNILSYEQQLGLLAEVWFLSVWLFPQVGAEEAVQRWRGPSGSRHDFEWPGRSVEVKATTSTRGLIHRINGLDQLAPPENGELLFFSLQLHEEAGSDNTLISVISACRARLEVNADLLVRFDSALAHAGYSPAFDEDYSKHHFRIVTESLFQVRDDFPRLTAMQLASGIPAGVERVEYEINLGGFHHLSMAHDAADCPHL